MISRASRSHVADEFVLRPRSGWRAIDTGELWRFRDLFWSLAIRDVKLRYRQTALGVIWIVLQPLLAAGIFAFVFGTVAKLPTGGVPYVVFAYAGLLGWNAFNTTVSKISTSMVQHAGMVQKIYFPRLSLPLSVLPGTILDFGVALTVMGVLMAQTQTFPGWSIVLLPVWLVLVLMIATGMGLIAAALMVSYRDVAQMLPVAIQMILYASPVAYALSAVPSQWRFWYSLNPLVGIFEGFRWSLVSGAPLSVGWSLYSAVVSVVALVAGALVFTRMERRFADVV